MTATLMFGPPPTSPGRATFTALAARELRRFVLNPVFLFGVALAAGTTLDGAGTAVTEIDTVNPYPAIFLGGFGMMATYWLTRSMRASEPVVGVTPVTRPARTAALCTVAIVPFACGCLALLRFLQLIPVSSPLYGPFSPSARVAVLVGQIVVPALGGPLLGVALGRWVRFPGAAFVLFLVLYGWVSLVTILSMSHPDSAPVAVLRLFAPFAFFTSTGAPAASRPGAGRRGSSSAGSSPCARSRSWWRCCAGPRAGAHPDHPRPRRSRARRP